MANAAAPSQAVGFLYPGFSAEDDYPRLERILSDAGADVRLPLVHTDIGEDAHRPDALLEMGSAKRLAIAATYPEDVGELFTAFLKAAGTEVVSMRGSGIITAAEVGTWGKEEVLALARDGDHPEAQAVLLPDTALHTAAWIPDL